MGEFFRKLFDTGDFPARWHCGNWTAGHGWLHVVSDLAIFGAYVAIPVTLLALVARRPDLPFPRVFWLFGAFILFCGLGHLIEATIFWRPWYRLSGVVKAMTAVVSWATVFALTPVFRRAIELPGLAQDNDRLRTEVEARRRTEAALEVQAEELQRHNAELASFARSVIDREERLISLKEEVNELLVATGHEPRYTAAGDVA